MDYLDSLKVILLFGALGVFFSRIAWLRGFYRVPVRLGSVIRVSLSSVGIVFGIYLGVTWVLAPVCFHGLKLFYAAQGRPISSLSVGWLQLLLLLSVAFFFFLFCRTLPSSEIGKMWKNKEKAAPITTDILFAGIAWILSFPFVMAVGQLVDTIVYFFFGVDNFEQLAVRYLKMALSAPEQLFIALGTILVVAPVIEEVLFRGFLQNYFKKKWGPKIAIFLSSACFGVFHVAAAQGLGNISLVFSLFTFALFLGFIYERQASLFASISLHVLFNTISTMRVLLAS